MATAMTTKAKANKNDDEDTDGTDGDDEADEEEESGGATRKQPTKSSKAVDSEALRRSLTDLIASTNASAPTDEWVEVNSHTNFKSCKIVGENQKADRNISTMVFFSNPIQVKKKSDRRSQPKDEPAKTDDDAAAKEELEFNFDEDLDDLPAVGRQNKFSSM